MKSKVSQRKHKFPLYRYNWACEEWYYQPIELRGIGYTYLSKHKYKLKLRIVK